MQVFLYETDRKIDRQEVSDVCHKSKQLVKRSASRLFLFDNSENPIRRF
jgi:hypothetical protein